MHATTPTAANTYTRIFPLTSGRLPLVLVHFLTLLSLKLSKLGKFSVQRERQRLLAFDAQWFKPDARLRREALELGAAENPVPTLRYTMPNSRPERVILYLHGGAFAFRLPNAHATLVAQLCSALEATAWLPQYRLAPEAPYPAAIDDCFAAWQALLAQGMRPGQIVIAGDSAGGNLTLALLHRIKQAGGAMPACAVMLSPVVDMTLSSHSLLTNASSDPMFDLPALMAFRAMYAAPRQMCNPDVSPLFADMQGYPPLLFQCSRSEMLRDESVRAAARAHAAGVSVSLQLWEKMPHVFQCLRSLPQAREAIEWIVRFVRQEAGWVS